MDFDFKTVSVGGLMLLFVGVIVALAIFPAIAENVASVTDTSSVVNQTIAAADFDDGDETELFGKAASDVVAVNITDTDGAAVSAGNYTIANNVLLSDGTLGSTLTANPDTNWDGVSDIGVSYTFEPVTYGDSGTRGIAGTILIFAALGLLGFVVFQFAGGRK